MSLHDDFYSAEWWGSVVVAGFVVGLAAAYAKSVIDRTVGGLTARWRERTRLRLEADNRLVEEGARRLLDSEAFYLFTHVQMEVRRATAKILLAIATTATATMLLAWGFVDHLPIAVGLGMGILLTLVTSPSFYEIGFLRSRDNMLRRLKELELEKDQKPKDT